jgi:NCS1 family nucleobase:cation symporter-1
MAERRARKSKAAQHAERFAIESEPGLTTAQLMLYNHDLAPVEPERRQWGMFDNHEGSDGY